MRNKDPPVYNVRRLFERPLPPNLPDRLERALVDNEIDAENPQLDNGNQLLAPDPEPQPFEEVLIENDNNIEIPNLVEEQHFPNIENDESAVVDISIKEEEEFIIMDVRDEAEFDRIFDENMNNEHKNTDENISGDLLNLSLEAENVEPQIGTTNADEINDIEFEETESFPKPMACTSELLSKIDDDPITGNLPYATKVKFDSLSIPYIAIH